MSGELPETPKPNFLTPPYLWGGAFLLVLVGTLIFSLVIPSLPDKSSSPSSRSFSLSGHRAFREFMEQMGYRVSEGRASLSDMKGLPPIFFIDPDGSIAKRFFFQSLGKEIEKLLPQSAGVFVALPKWKFLPAQKDPNLVGELVLKNTGDIAAFARGLLEEIFPGDSPDLEIQRVSGKMIKAVWKGNSQVYNLEVNSLQVFSRIPLEASILAETSQGPLVIGLEGPGGGRLVLLSDSDLLNNYGLGRQENGLLALEMARYLAGEKKHLIVDEVSHGFGEDPNLWRILLTYPMVLITLHLFLIGLFWAYYASRPFFHILPAPRMERSRAEQIQTIGYLTYTGGDHVFFLRKFFFNLLGQLEDRYPLLKKMNIEEKLDFLEKLEKEKGISPQIWGIYAQVKAAKTPSQIEYLAKELYRWKERLIHVKFGGTQSKSDA